MFEVDWKDMAVADITAAPEQIHKIVFAYYDDLRRMFAFHASPGAIQTWGRMSLSQFLGVCEQCRMTDEVITTELLERLFVQMLQGEVDADIGDEEDELDELPLLADREPRAETKLNKSKKGKAASPSRKRSAKGKRQKQKQGSKTSLKNTPENMFTRAQFLEALIRIAVIKYRRLHPPITPAERVHRLMAKHLVPYGVSDGVLRFRDYLLIEPIQQVFRNHGKKLWALFSKYASRAEPSDPISAGMSIKDFDAFLKDHKLVDETLSKRIALQAFAVSLDENYGMTLADTPMRFPSFLEALARMADIKFRRQGPGQQRGPPLAEKLEMLCQLITGGGASASNGNSNHASTSGDATPASSAAPAAVAARKS